MCNLGLGKYFLIKIEILEIIRKIRYIRLYFQYFVCDEKDYIKDSRKFIDLEKVFNIDEDKYI